MTRRGLVLVLAICTLAAGLPGQGAATARSGVIAFERNYSIYVVNPDGSGLRLLAKKGEQGPGEGDGYLYAPAFTPDGSRITYVNGIRTTHQSVVVRPAAGGSPKLFPVEGILLSGALSFSPDGRLAVVSRLGDPPPHSALYVASTTRRNSEVQLTGHTPRKGRYDWSPDWSPDGRSIVYWREDSNQPSRLMMLTRKTMAVRVLVPGERPDWSPDGRLIAFARTDGVYVCSPDGSAVRKVVAIREPGHIDFSPDGRRLAFEARGALWVASIDGGGRTKIAERATGGVDWS